MPRRYNLRELPSRYTPLIAYLATREGDSATLTFTEIEVMIGVPLSVSVQINGASWASDRQRFARDLTAIGWRARPRVRARAVEFRRLPVTRGDAECED